MPNKILLPLLLIAGLMSACGGSTPPLADPCVEDPSLAGCVGVDFTTSVSIDSDTAPALTSNLLHDLLDISQIALTATLQSYTYKDDILSVINTQDRYAIDYTNHNCGIPLNFQGGAGDIDQYLTDNAIACSQYVPHFSLPCDNGNTYDIFVKITDPSQQYNLGGTIMEVIFNSNISGNPAPGIYCQIGNMKISGMLYLAQVSITNDPADPESWSQTSELWPTVTIHDGIHWTDISNPMRVEASYTPEIGLTFTGTVMDNSATHTQFSPNEVNGIQFTHYPAGSDPNVSPETTYNTLHLDSTVTIQMDSTDPATATLLSLSTAGVMNSNKTGLDLVMNINTTDSANASQPLIWDNAIEIAPKWVPPVSGSIMIDDIDTGSQAVTTIDATNAAIDPGKLNIVVTDNSLPVSSPNHVTVLPSNWGVLMKRL